MTEFLERRRYPRAGPLLRWYYTLKYRAFRRERRPLRWPSRSPRAADRCAGVRRSATGHPARALSDDCSPAPRGRIRAAAMVLRPALRHAVLSGRHSLRRERPDSRLSLLRQAPPARHHLQRARWGAVHPRSYHGPGALAGGSSYVNLLDGDAQTVAFTVATRQRMSVYRRLGGTRMLLLIALHSVARAPDRRRGHNRVAARGMGAAAR